MLCWFGVHLYEHDYQIQCCADFLIKAVMTVMDMCTEDDDTELRCCAGLVCTDINKHIRFIVVLCCFVISCTDL